MPDKLRALQQLFALEGSKYNVFPLDDSTLTRFMSVKPNYTPGRTLFTYSGELINVPFPGTGGAPNLLDRSYTITAKSTFHKVVPKACWSPDGGRYGGYGFYSLKGRPVFTWNLVQLERVKWQGKQALTPGKHALVFDWKYDGPGMGKSATGTLTVDGQVLDSHPMSKSLGIVLPWAETFDVDIDTGTPVDDKDYAVPFKFTGKISRLTIKLGPEQLAPAEKEKISETIRNKQ